MGGGYSPPPATLLDSFVREQNIKKDPTVLDLFVQEHIVLGSICTRAYCPFVQNLFDVESVAIVIQHLFL